MNDPSASPPAILPEGLALIRRFEGLRLEAYRDPAGVWTIGYGHRANARPGLRIDADTAERWLRADVSVAIAGVDALVPGPLAPHERAALTSLVFNIGAGAFARSTVRRCLLRGDREAAARAFGLWTKARQAGRLVELPGLVRRRAAEAALFLGDERHDPPGPASPQAPAPTEKPLSRSRTLAGAGMAAAAGVGTAMAEATALLAADTGLLGRLVATAPLILALMVIMAAAWVAYARLDDRQQGRN